MTHPSLYASSWLAHARRYRDKGWTGTLPLRPGTKWPPPTGYTGWEGAWPTSDDLEQWEREYGTDANLALRLPPVVIGLDVDQYDGKVGGRSLVELMDKFGPLPPTWTSSARSDGVSGIRFYRVPPKLAWPGQAARDIEIIQYGHRYAVVWPSRHPDGGTYGWVDGEGQHADGPPTVGQLPELPQAWIDGLTGGEEAKPHAKAEVGYGKGWAWVLEHQTSDDTCRCVESYEAKLHAATNREHGSAHDATREALVPAVRLAERGCHGVFDLLALAQEWFIETVGREDADGEYVRMLDGAVAMVAADPRPEATCQDFARVVGDVTYLKAEPTVSTDANTAELLTNPEVDFDSALSRVDWASAWEADESEDWIVEPLLARGRSVALYSPPKVGKSLLTLELAAAIATGREVLGTDPVSCRVLYVDMENNIAGDIVPRLKRLGYGPEALHNLIYLSFPVLGTLDTPMGAAALIAAVDHYEAQVVIVDTVSRLIAGEENANDTWLAVYRLVGLPMKQRGVAVLRLDHTGKDESKGMRGGSAKYGDVDAVWRLSRATDEVFTLSLEATRMPVAEQHITLHRTSGARLQHSVDAKGKAAAWQAKVDARVALLDELELPNDAGERVVKEAVKAVGQEPQQKITREAIKIRKARIGGFTHPGVVSDSPGLGVVVPFGGEEASQTSSEAPDAPPTTPPVDNGVSAGQGRRQDFLTTSDDMAHGQTSSSPPTLGGDDMTTLTTYACSHCGAFLAKPSADCPECGW